MNTDKAYKALLSLHHGQRSLLVDAIREDFKNLEQDKPLMNGRTINEQTLVLEGIEMSISVYLGTPLDSGLKRKIARDQMKLLDLENSSPKEDEPVCRFHHPINGRIDLNRSQIFDLFSSSGSSYLTAYFNGASLQWAVEEFLKKEGYLFKDITDKITLNVFVEQTLDECKDDENHPFHVLEDNR